MHETELIGCFKMTPLAKKKKLLYVYVLNFAKASPSSIAVIRPFSRGGCLQKTSRIKYICHVQWKVPIDKAKSKMW